MRSYYIPDSVLPQRYHFSRQDIEKAARDELRQVECLPKSPEPIDLEKYLFRRHDKLEPQSTDRLATGVLGAADLMNPRKPAIWISQAVFDGAPARYRSTLAHEIGHLVLHASLYIDEEFPRIVAQCRGGADLARGFQCGIDQIKERPQAPLQSAHPLFHLEYQANLFMVAMLTPTPLVRACVEPWTCTTTRRDGSRISSLDESARSGSGGAARGDAPSEPRACEIPTGGTFPAIFGANPFPETQRPTGAECVREFRRRFREKPTNIMVTTITGTLSDTERDAFVEGVNRLEATLSSIDLVTLSLSEVSRLSKAGPASASFVAEGLELASRNLDLLTASMKPEEVKEKLQLIRNLDVVTAVLSGLQEKLAHTAMVAKSEAYEIARTAYLLSKRKKVSGIVESHNKLAKRFKNQGQRKTAKDSADPEAQ